MEIHELNTFSGTPGASDYLATDNGSDTSKISIKAITDPLNDRIDNIIAGDAPSAAEVTDARMGADGSVYPTLGDAIRKQVRGIENTLYNREFNVLDFVKKNNETSSGVNYVWNDDGSCTVSGTATGISFNRIFYNPNGFPPFLSAGKFVAVKIESDNPNSLVQIQIFKCVNGSLSSILLGMNSSFNTEGVWQGYIPDDLSGILIRVFTPNGQTVNETVRMSIVPATTMDNNPDAYFYAHDADDLKRNGMYFASAGGTTEVANLPVSGAPFWIDVHCIGEKSATGVLQIAYPWVANAYDAYFRVCKSGIWTDWRKLGSGNGGGSVIENTYNITTNPHITTDTNGWLQPVDTESADETGKTDMTGAIMSMLTDTGYCHLAKGIYYVSGNIDMPDGSTLEGCGEDTIIRLLSSVESGYCVKVTKYNTVKGIRFSGAYSDISVASETVGERDAIRFIGSYDGQGQSFPTVEPNMITNCFFDNFSGSGIYCHNTGGGTKSSLLVSDCYIRQCIAGINIDYYSEYSKFTNIITYKCHYACINNGGNNVFTACTFHGTIGFSMDGSRNSAHGSVVGCTFNHIDNWNRPSTLGGGTAILVKNAVNGFIFTGCQLWYGAIDVRASRGIAFSDCLIGGNSPEISVTGAYPAFFENCIFHATPTLNVNSATKFDNCYLDSDGSAIGA